MGTRASRPGRRTTTPKPRRSPWAVLGLAVALALAFYLGRWSAPVPRSEEPSPLVPPGTEPDPISPGATALSSPVLTSTIGLCPCPRPKPPRMLPIARKQTPPRPVAAPERADPTEATARFLRAQASKLSVCAPLQGGDLHVHLEVEVAPRGSIDRVRVTNLDPLPGQVASCVEQLFLALKPPGFDARDSAVFALTVVL